MTIKIARILGLAAVAGVILTAGCRPRTEAGVPTTEPDLTERADTTLGRVAEATTYTTTNVAASSVDAARSTADATKRLTGEAIEKTGNAMEKAGEAMEKTGTDMQE